MEYSNLADGSYTFIVQVTNTAGASAEASHEWTVDTVPPNFELTEVPTNPSIGNSARFLFTSDVGDVQCKLDSGAFAPCTAGSVNSFTSLVDGPHTLTVRATDEAGNATVREYKWEVACAAPNFYVDATTGNDGTNTPGTSAQPFRSITHALTKASSGQTIKLLPGTYSAATTGEIFPLIVQPGVCLMGDVANKGGGSTPTRVEGLGKVTYPSGEEYNVAIGTKSDAIVAGLTISNKGAGVGIQPMGDGAIIYGNTIMGETTSIGYSGIFLRASFTKHKILLNRITNQEDGITASNYSLAGLAESNIITGNLHGVLFLTPDEALDLGGGSLMSSGKNQIYCNSRMDVWTNYDSTRNLANNQWDHVPPSSKRGGTGGGIDIYIFGGNPTLRTDGATLVSSPCP
ncbi:DUF1565 domain-containing protein [Archangium sp.]|uniref:DUF1565 domain-containing protein n=1 Tax=Archangium sp. TaxID=1872627 RepID=UPI002D2D4D83|nr:DUF1565 domain-containing protein [Archangium sp.]HYO56489.1 DUF1565 domain-containing protein [Archangium sp.]